MGGPDSLHQLVTIVNLVFHVLLLVLRIAPRITDLDRIVRVLVQVNAHRIVLAVKQRDAFGFLPVHYRRTVVEHGDVRIADPLAEYVFDGMLPASKIVFQVQLILRRGSLVGGLVSFIAVVNQDRFGLVGLDMADVDRSRQHMNILLVEDLETVLVRILDIVSVRNPGALGASVIKRIVAAGFFLILIREIPIAAQGLDRLIEHGARFAGVVGVVELDGRLGGRSGRGRWRGLGST